MQLVSRYLKKFNIKHENRQKEPRLRHGIYGNFGCAEDRKTWWLDCQRGCPLPGNLSHQPQRWLVIVDIRTIQRSFTVQPISFLSSLQFLYLSSFFSQACLNVFPHTFVFSWPALYYASQFDTTNFWVKGRNSKSCLDFVSFTLRDCNIPANKDL